jgi:hypothetical protein
MDDGGDLSLTVTSCVAVVLLQQQRVGTRGFVASIDADNT